MADVTFAENASDDGLDTMGYKQELHRGLGAFASFASGFSFVSILTTVFELFALGFKFGGPAFFWTWPIVFVGQFAVALVFAELSTRYPVSGAIYQWSRRVSSGTIGWFAGWFMMIGYIVSVAAIALAMQTVLPGVWSGFQLIGTDQSVTSPDGGANAILLGTVTIAVCALISSLGVQRMATLTKIGVGVEIVGVILMIGVLFFKAERGPSVLLDTGGVQGKGSYLWPFLTSALMATYVMYGFDSAAELSEETNDPRRTAPLAITRCMLVSAIGGGLLIVGTLMAAPSLTSGDLAKDGIAYVLKAQVGDVFGRTLLAIVSVAIFSAALAIQASATRVMFSMARDGRLPFSTQLARVSPRTHTPLLPGVVVCVLAIAVLWINYGQPDVFTNVTAVAVVIVYGAYLMVTVPLLYHRITGHAEHGRCDTRYFNLGRWGLPINAVAVAFGAFLMLDVGWPRASVYDPAGGHWYLQWFATLFVAGALALGALAFATRSSDAVR